MQRGEVLVAILNNMQDFALAHDRHWYRIPVSSANKWLKNCWPPQWLTFYQTKIFGKEAHAIRYYAKVVGIYQARRYDLFPDEPPNPKSQQLYYQIYLEPLQQLPQPILSRRFRRIVFIPTTWLKFINAVEINDLYDESPLEDRLWAELKRLEVNAERQEFVKVNGRNYALDFAIYCISGKLNIETDGDTWHGTREQIPVDNLRDNDLETHNWKLLRFNTLQVREQMEEYCLPTITENINNLGGLVEGRLVPRKIDLGGPDSVRQMSLFDD